MAQQRQINKPSKVNRDADEKYLPTDSSYYMLNCERSVSADGTLGKLTPMPGNELLCEMEESIGTDYTVMAYKSPLTNEVYFGRMNSQGIDYILRVNADATCEIIYQGDCLNFKADPEFIIHDWRVFLKYDKICAHRQGKQLVWVDGSDNPIGMIDTEASIATNNFTTPFFDNCQDRCALLQLCVPQPCGALVGEFVPFSAGDVDLQNHLLDVGVQVIFRHVYYDMRASEWSDRSSLYYQDSKGCFDSAEGLPRCIKFRVPIGNPMVEKIQVAFSTNNGQQWFLSDTVEKYNPYTSQSQMWYERTLAPLTNYSNTDCSFDYTFCNDKDCAVIDVKETDRVFNPMPRDPQGFFRIKDSLGFYNYIKGNCPLSLSETKKVELSLNCDSSSACQEEFVTITAKLIIHNFNTNLNQFIYRIGGDAQNPSTPDDKTDTAYFGGVTSGPKIDMAYDQFFTGETRDFNMYVEGTNIAVEMEQWKSEANFVNTRKFGVLSSVESVYNPFTGASPTDFYFQRCQIRVKKGTRGFLRIASHKEQTGIGASQNTSTFVGGTLNDLFTYTRIKNINSGLNAYKTEIYFDTCDVVGGELNIDETFVVVDMVVDNSPGNHSSSSYSGYLSDNGNKPIEGAEIWYNSSRRRITDHNGFYFFNLYGDENEETITVSVRGEQDCVSAWQQLKTQVLSGAYNTLSKNNIKITTSDNAGYEDNFIEIVRVQVLDCDSAPVAGIRVAISGSKYKVTEAVTGEAVFRLRNYSTRTRAIRAVIMNNNYCITLDCDGNCNPCMPETALTTLSACFDTDPTLSLAVDGLINVSIDSISKKGLKAGGRYKWALVAQGDCGRISAAYEVSILDGSLLLPDSYMNIPKTQNKNGLSFCSINYNVDGINLPAWANCLKIVRSENLNGYVLQWVVDKIERTNDNKIKLTIQSLNDYNKSFNFESNTSYQYLKGDRVEFISNGDGLIFDTATNGILNYQILSPFNDVILSGVDNTTGNFFNQILIEDDFKLGALKEGAKIEIQRPKECIDENISFFEIAVSLAVAEISGVMTVLQPTGNFKTFDTYFVNRQIGKFAPQTFEHRNPSDFWGDTLNGISDVGKVHFENKFENEKRYGRNITINTLNQFNRFGDFEKTLDAPEQGDLTGVHVYDGKIGLGIGQYDNFLFQVSDNFLRLGQDGVVRAASADSLISDTDPKISGIFGCAYEDTGSIYFGDGYVTWIDSRKNALVKHDFNTAKDISFGKMQSWFRRKIQQIKTLNSVSGYGIDKYRWITGFNYFNNSIHLSVRKLTDTDISNQKDALLQIQETVRFEPAMEEFLSFSSFIQQAYSTIELHDARGAMFLSSTGNKIWRHPIVPLGNNYNTFNGISCDMLIGLIINDTPDKIKVAVSLEVQSESRWYVTKIETDKAAFDSEIPPAIFKKTERKWNASFLGNKNSKGGLHGMDKRYPLEKPRGYYIKFMMCKDNTDSLKVNTIDTAKQKAYTEIDMVLSKIEFSEQSGFTNNI